jgi:hypothetical protein
MEEVIFPLIYLDQQQYKSEDGQIPRARLIMDGHSTRRLKLLWKQAHGLGIDVHILPSHSSHLIQPLDRSVFGNMKRFN